jgi:hypothetical protein
MSTRDGPLERWVRAGLITADQRVAIETYERDRREFGSRTAVISEVLVYIGAAAVLGALMSVAAQLTPGPRAALMAVLAVAAGVAGTTLERGGARSQTRAAEVLWFLSVVFGAGAGAYLSGSGQRGVVRPLLFSGVPAFSLASVYWALRRSGPQLVALYGSVLMIIFGIANAVTALTAIQGGLLLAALGAVGLAAAQQDRIAPVDVADQIFGFSLTLGFFIAGSQEGAGWAEVLSIVAAGSLLWASVRVRSTELLFTGALSLFVILSVAIGRHFQDEIGLPIVLLVVGAMLIGGAAMVARMRPLTRDDDLDE